jgi:hypothetical protein
MTMGTQSYQSVVDMKNSGRAGGATCCIASPPDAKRALARPRGDVIEVAVYRRLSPIQRSQPAVPVSISLWRNYT